MNGIVRGGLGHIFFQCMWPLSSMRLTLILPLICVGCIAPREEIRAPGAAPQSLSAEFVGTQGTIRIDLAASTIAVGSATHALENCSTQQQFCFENQALGFHVVFPKRCDSPYHVEGETDGGFSFRQIASDPHQDIRFGRYVSSLSDRFSYSYSIARGLFEIRHDLSGRVTFGRGSASTRMNLSELEPYTFRTTATAAFLRCENSSSRR